MEMDGTNSHGAVVAHEYGISAVVGVAGATERITTGQEIMVDGTSGTVRIEAALPLKESFVVHPQEERPGKEVGAGKSVVPLSLLYVVV